MTKYLFLTILSFAILFPFIAKADITTGLISHWNFEGRKIIEVEPR